MQRHALSLVCVGCAGAVVSHLTAAVRRVVAQKRVQNGPYTKVSGQSPKRKTGSQLPCGSGAFLLSDGRRLGTSAASGRALALAAMW